MADFACRPPAFPLRHSLRAAVLVLTARPRRAQGADAPLSGLVATLTALQLLTGAANSGGGGNPGAPGADYQRQLVFVALAGEPWGYMGSRALLWQLESGSAGVAGLDLSLVDQVIEVGAIGRALRGGGGGAALFGNLKTQLRWLPGSEGGAAGEGAGGDAFPLAFAGRGRSAVVAVRQFGETRRGVEVKVRACVCP